MEGVDILLYLAPERPDIMFVLKKLSAKLSSPTNRDMEMLGHVGKYLEGTPEISLVHERSFPRMSFQDDRNIGKESHGRDVYNQQSILEVCSDSVGQLIDSQDKAHHAVLSC